MLNKTLEMTFCLRPLLLLAKMNCERTRLVPSFGHSHRRLGISAGYSKSGGFFSPQIWRLMMLIIRTTVLSMKKSCRFTITQCFWFSLFFSSPLQNSWMLMAALTALSLSPFCIVSPAGADPIPSNRHGMAHRYYLRFFFSLSKNECFM